MYILALISCFLALAVAAIPKPAYPSHGFQKKQLAPRDAAIKLHIALRQHDGGAAIERQLLQASDPESPVFRQHLTAQQVAVKSYPPEDNIVTMERWLSGHGMLHGATLFNGIMEVDTTIRKAEKLLNTTYFVWTDGEQDVVRTELYHLPDAVWHCVDFIAPTTVFPRHAASKPRRNARKATKTKKKGAKRGAKKGAKRASFCGTNDDSTPACIRQVYGIDYIAEPNRTTFAVYATEGATYNPKDLQNYLSKYNSPAASAGAAYQVIGSGDPAEDGGIGAQFETALDTQTLMGLAWPAQGVLYNLGGVFGPNTSLTYDPFVKFLTEMIANSTVPSVVSFSESMPEDRLDVDYARRLCSMFAQIAARGVTLVFSSGDNGPNGDVPTGDHKMTFEPEFPASCPWVLAVGGTTNLAAEEAATKSTIPLLGQLSYTASGGGFSNYFPAPSWQNATVKNYVSQNVPPSYFSKSGFNPTGRGIPDVSAFSTSFPTYAGIINFPVSGTSASTPTWAAVIALLNDYEAGMGRPTLGFVNPWLYSLKNGTGLTDIVAGGNNVGDCDLLGGCTIGTTYGYNVTTGWDPVTGLGSPIWQGLVESLDNCNA